MHIRIRIERSVLSPTHYVATTVIDDKFYYLGTCLIDWGNGGLHNQAEWFYTQISRRLFHILNGTGV